jgi:N6-adenosine-specific RNA methylase IME4
MEDLMGRRRIHVDDKTRWRENKRRQRHPTSHFVAATQTPGVYTFTLDSLIAAGQTFPCIYPDPPWPYANQGTRGSTKPHYQAMTIEAIGALPVGVLAAPAAHVWLWTTKDFRHEAEAILTTWGFTLQGEVIWAKTTQDGKKIHFGGGNYLRMAHEILYLGTRGDLPRQSKGVPSVILAPRGSQYSEKPAIFRDHIEQFSPGPYLELFGRKAVPGWTVRGNECLPAQGRLFQTRVG